MIPYDPETDGPHTAVVKAIHANNQHGVRPSREDIHLFVPHYDEATVNDALDHLEAYGKIYAAGGMYAYTGHADPDDPVATAED